MTTWRCSVRLRCGLVGARRELGRLMRRQVCGAVRENEVRARRGQLAHLGQDAAHTLDERRKDELWCLHVHN